MVETVGLVGMGSGSGVVRPAQAASSAKAEEGVTTLAEKIQPISPSTRSDPMTGVLIMEYFSSDGQVRMQIPSEAAVAYLRSGLTATGAPAAKPSVAAGEQVGVIA